MEDNAEKFEGRTLENALSCIIPKELMLGKPMSDIRREILDLGVPVRGGIGEFLDIEEGG